ncbi:Site-specific recombinase XerD [Halogranum amylolyticum]|uniref:Site-specific recombinase XerD n=1 Tax=Halogranum amylolyticum TaxID=660520 RepID=A0A1H8TNL7_9EURY|nr:tyrosine-type recombinase/integrase [Halogranum amylolyticum]SEO92457.1 Site-specific recombinase XerD [Halogranum amylolyticum]
MPKRERIRVLKERVRAGGAANFYDETRYEDDTISDDDAATLLTVSDQFDLHDYSDNRHEKLLRHLVRVAEQVGGLTEALEDRDAAEDLVRWINLEYDNPRTKCDYRLAIRAMGKHALRRGKHGDPPESISWMSANTPRNYNPTPSRADMLDWEDDVLPLINEGTGRVRNKALFAVQFEGGFRPHCELYEMTVGDVKDTDYGVEIEVDGKTGQRSVTMILSLPYLNRWLGDHHPCPGDDNAYLWVKSDGERMSYTTFQRYFKRAADRIDLDKPVTPKNFRKSNATWLAKLGKNESFIEDRQGRKRGSDAISHYVAMYGEDRAREYASMHGQDVETEDPQDYTPVSCPRCRQQTPRDKEICMWCNQALDHDTYEDLAEAESTVTDMALQLFQQDDEFLEEVLTRKAVTQMLLDDDEFFEQAVDIADELDADLLPAVK